MSSSTPAPAQTFAPEDGGGTTGGVIVERDAPDRVLPSERDVPTQQVAAPGANDVINDVSLGRTSSVELTDADAARATARSPAERLPMGLLAVVLVLLVGAVGTAAWAFRMVDPDDLG